MASLTRNTAARLVADGLGLGLGVLSGIVTARWLGPSGKGALSTLAFLTAFFVQLCNAGLGDAAIVRVGQGRSDLQQALSATAAGALVLGWAGGFVMALTSWAVFRDDLSGVGAAVVVACLTVPAAVAMSVLCHILNSREKIVGTSIVVTITSAAATLCTWLFVAVAGLDVLGGALASLVSAVLGLIAAGTMVFRLGLDITPRWNRAYLVSALRYGLPIQASYLLMFLAGKLDLLVVYSLTTAAEAGMYSVALVVGTLVAAFPLALSFASFPRLARLAPEEGVQLTLRLCRVSLPIVLGVCSLLALGLPWMIPFLFGEPFAGAVLPATVLTVGGIFWSVQWLLSRAAAAAGDTRVLLCSYAASLVAMLAADVLLVPRHAILGAAIAATLSQAVGAVVSIRMFRRAAPLAVRAVDFIPRVADFRRR